MSKTFDNISEAASTNYLFLKAQMTLSLAQEKPTPPPLYALSLPSELVRAARWLVKSFAPRYLARVVECFREAQKARTQKLEQRKSEAAQNASREPGKSEAGSVEPSQVDLETSVEVRRRLMSPDRACLQAWKEAAAQAQVRRCLMSPDRACLQAWKAAAVQAQSVEAWRETLAKTVTQYVLDHQADVAQEERWRTSMQRKMDENNRSFRELVMKANQEMKTNQDQMKATQKQNLANQEQMKDNQKKIEREMKYNQHEIAGQIDQNFRELRAELGIEELLKNEMKTHRDQMDQHFKELREKFFSGD